MSFKEKTSILIVLALLLFININLNAQSNSESLTVFPNPFFDKATLEISIDNINPTEIVIFNIIGKEIHRQKLMGLGYHSKFEVDFSFLNPGIYFINLLSDSKTIATKKIVKKR